MKRTWKSPLSLAACLLLAAALVFFVARYWDLHVVIYRGDSNQASTADMSGHDHSNMTMNAEALDPAATSDNAAAAYAASMSKMHGPMMAGMNNPDPDAAFILGMIPHHQGAIDMARVVLRFGKDDFTRHLAQEIITAQELEIAEMQKWLAEKGVQEAK